MIIPEILLIETEHRPGSLATVLGILAELNIVIEGLSCVRRTEEKSTWELVHFIRKLSELTDEELEEMRQNHVAEHPYSL